MSLNPYKYSLSISISINTSTMQFLFLLAVVGCQTGEGRDYLGTADKYVHSFLSIFG